MHLLPNSTSQWLSSLAMCRPPITLSLVKTDASLRSYHRIKDANHQSSVLCKLEPQESFDRVLTIQKLYENSGVAVPKALHWQNPYILFEDVGDIHLKTFLERAPFSTSLQNQILDQVLAIQRISTPKIPEYTTFSKVAKEREFIDFFNFARDYPWKDLATHSNQVLLGHILALPLTTVHKDFHWENLMIQQNQIRVLDYSDSLEGPPTYDLASLIADRGFYPKFPRESLRLIDRFCQQCSHSVRPEHLWGSVALRLLKIIGNFDRLSSTIHPRYRSYQKEAIQTLTTIPWKTHLPKTWYPEHLSQLGEALCRL